MKKKLKYLLVCLLMTSVSMSFAQTKVASGRVISAKTGEAIVGASVRVKGTTKGLLTDVNGEYKLNVKKSTKKLVISFIGMKTVKVLAKPNQIVKMEQDISRFDEVVVTALGIKRSEKTLGYSATNVNGEELSKARNTGVTNALSGKIAGLQIKSTSSDPGSATSVTIRGFGSINGSNQPLYIIDGVPLQNTTFNTSGHSIGAGGISNIAPDDVESMTVLKGAAATALYGSRAANGIIMITTKEGKKGKNRNFTINYNGGVQVRQVSHFPEFQNDFGQGWNGNQTYIENGSWGPKLDGSDVVYGPIWNNQQLIHKYSALKNNVKDFFELGITQNHNISLSGGSDNNKMNYYLSYSNVTDDGIMPSDADKYDRNTLAYRGSFEAAKWLKLSSSINFAKSQTDVVGSFQGTSVIDGLYEMPREVSIVDMQDLDNAFFTPEAYFTPYGITNPYWSLANNYNHLDSKQIFGKLQADIKPLESLTLTYRYGFDYTDYDTKIGKPQINLDDALIDNDYGYAPSEMNQDGYVYARYGRKYEINHDFLMNYDRRFNDFSITTIAGVNIMEQKMTRMIGQTDVLSFYSDFWDLSNGATKTEISERQYTKRMIGAFGDITLGYDDMLFLNLTARNDWSSTLPEDKNSFFYPGATLSWVFTKLIPKNNILNFGKVRLAYGKTGNDAELFMTQDSYTQAYANGYYGRDILKFPLYSLNSFLLKRRAGNNKLEPEISKEFEAGVNLKLFSDRLGLDFAYYNRTTSGQIFELPVDPATGYTSKVINFGDVRNKGVELLIDLTPIKTNKFTWNVGVNFTKNINEVLTLPDGIEGGKVEIDKFSAGNNAVYMYAEKGKPIGQYYTYLPKRVEDKTSPYYGDLIVGKDGLPMLTDKVKDTGLNMNHDWTAGIITSLSAYGFTLSAVLDIRQGGSMFSRTKELMAFTGNGIATTYNDRKPFIIPNSVLGIIDDNTGEIVAYTENKEQLSQTNQGIQKYYSDTGAGEGGLSYMVDRSFTKLRNITLTYELPTNWSRSLYVNGISLSAFVNNVFTWTAKDNYYVDPESTTTGTDLRGNFGELYVNPANRVYGFNLNVKL